MNQRTLWIVTGLVAVLMLAGAIFVARQRSEAPAPVVAQSPAQQDTVIATPAAPQESVTPKPAAATEAERPVVYDEVKVDILKIAGRLKMASPDIPATGDGSAPRYPIDMTCYRRNASPALNWRDAPSATKSYVLVLERRAPNEKASWSWIMFNIPAGSSGLPAKISAETLTAAQGVFGANQYGHQAYTGPCDPKGTFPYVLRLFALDTMLDLQPGAQLHELLPAINGHVIDAAEIRALHYLQM